MYIFGTMVVWGKMSANKMNAQCKVLKVRLAALPVWTFELRV
jgi:hypothetical protein